MKKVNILLLCIGACLNSYSLFAQQRNVDLSLFLDSPAAVDTFTGDTAVPFQVAVINNGPDTLNAGDQLYVVYGNQNMVYHLTNPLLPGDGVGVVNVNLQIEVGSNTYTKNICASIFDDPNNQVTIQGVPVSVDYIDPNPDNNEICTQITVLAGGSTAVNSVGKTDFGFKLYPNPYSNGNIHIENDKGYTIKQVRIADITGREVWQLAGNGQSGQSFALPDYIADGLYLLHVLTAKGEQVLRLQVMH